MIRVTNGMNVLTVTKGAFRELYRDAGFYPVDDQETAGTNVSLGEVNPPPKVPEGSGEDTGDVEDDQEETEDEDGEESEDEQDLTEIPLSEMSFEQLQKYADELGVDYTGMRSKKEIRNAIRLATQD